VLHGFWIPSFLLKVDAVPGITTKLTLKPTEIGSYDTDPNLRVQCSQLCGLSHSRMMLPVRVVSREDYDKWVTEQTGAAGANVTPTGPIQELTIVAKSLKWDQATLTVAAGSSVKLTVDNQDNAIPHNFSLYASEDAAKSGEKAIAGTKPTAGVVQEELVFNSPAAGTAGAPSARPAIAPNWPAIVWLTVSMPPRSMRAWWPPARKRRPSSRQPASRSSALTCSSSLTCITLDRRIPWR